MCTSDVSLLGIEAGTKVRVEKYGTFSEMGVTTTILNEGRGFTVEYLEEAFAVEDARQAMAEGWMFVLNPDDPDSEWVIQLDSNESEEFVHSPETCGGTEEKGSGFAGEPFWFCTKCGMLDQLSPAELDAWVR